MTFLEEKVDIQGSKDIQEIMSFDTHTTANLPPLTI